MCVCAESHTLKPLFGGHLPAEPSQSTKHFQKRLRIIAIEVWLINPLPSSSWEWKLEAILAMFT